MIFYLKHYFRKLISLSLLMPSLFFSVAVSAMNNSITEQQYVPFQGRLHNENGEILNGIYQLNFKLYDQETGGTLIWSEAHENVSVVNGYINVLLGGINKLRNDSASTPQQEVAIDFSQKIYLGISIGSYVRQGGVEQVILSNELLPRHQLVPSFHSATSTHALSSELSNDTKKLGGQLPGYYAKQDDLHFIRNDLYYIGENGQYVDENGVDIPAGQPPVSRFNKQDERSYLGDSIVLWSDPNFEQSIITSAAIDEYLIENSVLEVGESFDLRPGIITVEAGNGFRTNPPILTIDIIVWSSGSFSKGSEILYDNLSNNGDFDPQYVEARLGFPPSGGFFIGVFNYGIHIRSALPFPYMDIKKISYRPFTNL